eukprot:UN00047
MFLKGAGPSKRFFFVPLYFKCRYNRRIQFNRIFQKS